MKRSALLLAACLAAAPLARAQAPAGPEFLANTTTPGAQSAPRLGIIPKGDFVVVWESQLQDGSGYGIFGQRFAATGVKVGAEFRVNSATAGDQRYPDIGIDGKGDFVVAWQSVAPANDIQARLFDRTGAPLGADFRVNAYSTGIQNAPRVSMDAAGNFVVVWQGVGPGEALYGIFGRRFDAAGTPIGGDFHVNVATAGAQRRPDVAVTSNGFAVVWDGPDASSNGVFARLYDAAGAPASGEIAVPTAAASQSTPTVGAQGTGFVVAWTSYSQDGSHNGVFAQRFSGAGAPSGGELAVNTQTADSQAFPTLASDELGNFVVVWESFLQDGSMSGVFGQRFTAAGARRGAEFQLNTFVTGTQAEVSVGSDTAGNFVAAWSSLGQDNSSYGVAGRRFQGLFPVGLAVDTLRNGVLEPSDPTSRLEPQWRNSTNAAQSFTGTIANFTGPLPANYGIGDAAGSYGTVAAGQAADCTNGSDCYSLSLTAPARPAAHWDTTLLETLGGASANAIGLQKRWTLHVGSSFTDVPSGNAFYRFIEALFHFGVTGGCTATSYCPGNPTTRDQMAVFVLVAREGIAYVPPLCTTPIFNDVPANNPFCRWVEELARRGVAGGCGNGNYCPNSTVTREQMPIFVLRTLDPTLTPQACAAPNTFADVPATSPFCPWIEELARRNVVTGCGGGNYCPADPVTREQMGVFISSTFGLTLYGP
jgi:hypothetical protein